MSLTLCYPSLSQNSWDPLLVIKKLVITKGYGVGASTMEKRFCSNAVRKFHVMDGQNTCDQITNDRSSKLE